MTRRNNPDVVLVRDELFAVLVKYAKQLKGSLPSQRQCRILCHEAGYKISRSTFDEHFLKLRLEGKVSVDPKTGALFIPSSQWEYQGEIS